MNQVLLPPSRAEHSASMSAWEKFVTGDSFPQETLEAPIVASWQRSTECGISPEAREAPVVPAGGGFEDLRWRYRELRNAATAIFAATTQLLTASRSMMLLTSEEGVILDAAGSTQTLDAGEKIHLMPGGDWREAAIGTNGIGLALATRAPAHVHAGEHFCESVKYWTCAAAPVCEPETGAILGVLDISGPPQTYHPSNLTLAVAAARQIETVLAGARTRERAQLLEACLARLSRADAAGLIAIDRRGYLVHVTGRVPLSIKAGERVPGLEPGASMETWASRLPQGLRPEWLNPVIVDGAQIGAMLVIPAPESRRARREIDEAIHEGSGRSVSEEPAVAHEASEPRKSRASGAAPTSDAPASEAVSFGPYLLYRATRRLERNGVAVSLGDRAFDILCVLTERAGEIVTNRELLARVWGKVVVGTGSLRFHINALRKALARDGRQTPYIKNVTRQGYTFIAPVRKATLDSAASTSTQVRNTPQRPTDIIERAAEIKEMAQLILASCERVLEASAMLSG